MVIPIEAPLTWKVYPSLADGVVLTTSTEPWVYGDYTVVVPADTMSRSYALCSVVIEDCGKSIYQLEMVEGPYNDNVAMFRFKGEELYKQKAIDPTTIRTNHELKARVAASSIEDETPEEVVISICYIS